jgi:hypothetical protein
MIADGVSAIWFVAANWSNGMLRAAPCNLVRLFLTARVIAVALISTTNGSSAAGGNGYCQVAMVTAKSNEFSERI